MNSLITDAVLVLPAPLMVLLPSLMDVACVCMKVIPAGLSLLHITDVCVCVCMKVLQASAGAGSALSRIDDPCCLTPKEHGIWREILSVPSISITWLVKDVVLSLFIRILGRHVLTRLYCCRALFYTQWLVELFPDNARASEVIPQV